MFENLIKTFNPPDHLNRRNNKLKNTPQNNTCKDAIKEVWWEKWKEKKKNPTVHVENEECVQYNGTSKTTTTFNLFWNYYYYYYYYYYYRGLYMRHFTRRGEYYQLSYGSLAKIM